MPKVKDFEEDVKKEMQKEYDDYVREIVGDILREKLEEIELAQAVLDELEEQYDNLLEMDAEEVVALREACDL